MKNVNLWESNYRDDFTYFSNINDYLNYLRDKNAPFSLVIRNVYSPNNKPSNKLEQMACRDNYVLTMVDSDHPIVVSNNVCSGYMETSFFEEHKQEIIKYIWDC